MNQYLLDESHPKTTFRLLSLLIVGSFLIMPSAYSIEKTNSTWEKGDFDAISTRAQRGGYGKKEVETLTEQQKVKQMKKKVRKLISLIMGPDIIETKSQVENRADGSCVIHFFVNDIKVQKNKFKPHHMQIELKAYKEFQHFIESANKEFKDIIQEVTDTDHPKRCIVTDPDKDQNQKIMIDFEEFSTKPKKKHAYQNFLEVYRFMYQPEGNPYKGTIVFEKIQPQD